MIPLLEVRELKKTFPIKKGLFRRLVGETKAIDNVSFSMNQGEVLGLVGESGSGKSTIGRMIAHLIPPTDGQIFFQGENLCSLPKKQIRTLRKQIQIVFQDPASSLNPRKTILENVGEALLVHKLVRSPQEKRDAVIEALHNVGLTPSVLNQYPHQFSGGQQQRLSLARALILKPQLLICDEITSALDLSVQAQVLNLLNTLKNHLGLSLLFISHDLAVIRHMCDRVCVLHKGQIVESGESETLFNHPIHPYTQTLLSSIPITHPQERAR